MWSVDLLCLGELLEILAAEPLRYTPEPALQPITSAVQKLLDQISSNADGCFVAKAASAVAKAIGAAAKEGTKSKTIDQTDAGHEAKRRKLTTQQKEWAHDRSGSGYADADDGGDWDFNLRDVEAFLKRQKGTIIGQSSSGASSCPKESRQPVDCDCGNPRKMQGGRHVCRYFGSFCCPGCKNRWTSAYTWKGEKQACRKCEMESLPQRTDPLDGSGRSRVGNNINGAHDCSRCSKCRKLGTDCTGGRGTWSN